MQQHTNPQADDPQVRQRWAYKYSVVGHGVDDDSRTCYDFSVGNIQLRPTRLPNDANLIRVYFAEVPWDDPEDYPLYRVAEKEILMSTGIPEVIRISPDDFELFD